jgi:hypothetical protein
VTVTFTVRLYINEDADRWDDFCENAIQATFLHSRRFLSYHGDRFCDTSLLIEQDGKLVGLFPAALDPNNSLRIVSHPGATYGGILHQGHLRGEHMISAIQAICAFYAAQGKTNILYKVVPAIYFKSPAHDDSYALFRIGASRIRCDLSSAIDLNNRLTASDRRKRSLKKSLKAGTSVDEGKKLLPAFWKVLTDNLNLKHSASPVHSLSEITLLADRFPENIKCICGIVDNVVVAGVILFSKHTAQHAQYIASNEIGRDLSSLDPVFEYCINKAYRDGKRWFDFGISNDADGMILNNDLYRFKSEFGGGGVVHEFFSINL